MNNLYVLIKNNFRVLILKKFKYTMMMIILPVIIAVGVSALLGGGNKPLRVGVVDYSNSGSSALILENIKADGTMDVIEMTEEEQDKAFTNRDINIGLIINKEFQEDIINGEENKVKILAMENEEIYKIIEGLIGSDISNMKKIAAFNEGNKEEYLKALEKYSNPDIKIKRNSLNDLYSDYTNYQTVIGFLIMFAFMRAQTATALIGEDRDQRVYTRILTTPAKKWEYYLANIISSFSMILCQISLSLIALKGIVKMEIGVPMGALFIILAAVSLVAVAVGIFTATVTQSRELSTIIINFIIMPFMFLGGCFVPIDMLSDTINKISFFTPIRWAMEAIINLQQGDSLTSVIGLIGVVILFAIAFFAGSIFCISRKDQVDTIG